MNIIEQAARYVAQMPPAISGSGGRKATFAVSVVLMWRLDLSEEEALPILLNYNKRCEPEWSEKELRDMMARAAKLTRFPYPRGHLRGVSQSPQPAKPAKPAKPLRLRKVNWQDQAAEARHRLAAEASVTPPEVPAATFSPEPMPDIFADALRIFNGRIIPEEDDLDPDMSERLAMINKVLEQRDEKGRVAFTRTEVESCAIGLRKHAGSHPAIDAMLPRLEAAKKSALTWQTLAARM